MGWQWKRSAVVATVLLFVCGAVYLNWQYAGEVVTTGEMEQGEDGGSTKVLGQATLVDGIPTTVEEKSTSAVSSYFDTARLSRQQSRDNALSLLREASEQENAEQTAIDEANHAIQTLAGYTMLETRVESLITAKGYEDCIAFMGEDSVSVVVSAMGDGLQTEDVAKITDIVLSETDYTADQIKIIEAE